MSKSAASVFEKAYRKENRQHTLKRK